VVDVAADDGVAHRGVGPVPLDDPLEEDAQHPQSLPLGVGGQRLPFDAAALGQRDLEVLDVVAADLGHGPHVGALEQPAGQEPQRVVG
jgi:hypothetical protein